MKRSSLNDFDVDFILMLYDIFSAKELDNLTYTVKDGVIWIDV